MDDAEDVDAAVNAVVLGCFMNQEQICMSTERIIVDEEIAQEFATKFAARAAALPAGKPREHTSCWVASRCPEPARKWMR